jgi:hypothetical protein
MRIYEITPNISHTIKPQVPLTPAQTRIAAIKNTVERYQQNLCHERDRQRQARENERQRKAQ